MFDTRHQCHVTPYSSYGWLNQVCTLHYILLSLLETFLVYNIIYTTSLGFYALPPGASPTSRRRSAGSLAITVFNTRFLNRTESFYQ